MDFYPIALWAITAAPLIVFVTILSSKEERIPNGNTWQRSLAFRRVYVSIFIGTAVAAIIWALKSL